MWQQPCFFFFWKIRRKKMFFLKGLRYKNVRVANHRKKNFFFLCSKLRFDEKKNGPSHVRLCLHSNRVFVNVLNFFGLSLLKFVFFIRGEFFHHCVKNKRKGSSNWFSMSHVWSWFRPMLQKEFRKHVFQNAQCQRYV